ncbi:MAG: methylenetetrahydrofolate reductase [Bacteroidales bacterium]|jgi:methylenetetrahydrofolate reductase (NADPH)|nr:methylenetetrahydrofolate reductase [Bacteroidales bacterium]
MKVIDIINSAKKTLFTFEILPPLKGHTIEDVYQTVDTLLPYNPSYINITNHQQEVVYIEHPDGSIERRMMRKRPGTIGLSAAIQHRYNIPVVPHLICGGHSKDQLEDQLIELAFLGIDNVLALRGDAMHGERRFIPSSGGYVHSDLLVKQICDLRTGGYLDESLKSSKGIDFCVGIAGYPEKHSEAPNIEKDLDMLKMKIDKGAEYIVTQLFFINDRYYEFVDLCHKHHIDVPIIAGIKPLQKMRDLLLLPQTFHVDFPNFFVAQIEQAKDASEIRKIGVDYSIRQVEDLLHHGVPGIHFYTQGKARSVAKVVEATF